ncbi:hypothetical protein NQ315_003680 [Exocentrus adspersus]|uniref:Uncharacterized protein n=1 Tax=Exocentrus adspersus TaxID=1586481 RepID=A0AAV8VAD7_9CUCU|nr:hypothetical protein NQ315_003680 [Exocentrus adspersus]
MIVTQTVIKITPSI